MTQTETLRLALEALTVLLDEWTPARQAQLKGMEAVTAIKAALEAKDEPVVWNEGVPAMLPKQKEGETFIVSYEPKLEAKDEPVAYLPPTASPDNACYNPPQRTWVGLTDEEIDYLVETEDWFNDPSDFAKIVQSKLKDKNI